MNEAYKVDRGVAIAEALQKDYTRLLSEAFKYPALFDREVFERRFEAIKRHLRELAKMKK